MGVRGCQVWDLGRGFCAATLMCHSSINSVRCSADGTAVVSGHFDGTLRFWDLRSGKLANEITGLHTQQITSVAIGLRTGMHSLLPRAACCRPIHHPLYLHSITPVRCLLWASRA